MHCFIPRDDDRDHFEGLLRWRYAGSQLFMRMSF